jgi:hypothetical protein
MSIDCELVEKFLREVESEILPSISAGATRLQGHQKLLANYHAARVAWQSGSVDHVQGITAAVNELCIARRILDDNKVESASYEPQLKSTRKTIDFLVYLVGSDARIFYDVKTIQPEGLDKWDSYKRAKDSGWFTPNTCLALEQEGMGGAIFHELLASRQKFIDYTLELEEKIRPLSNCKRTYFRLVLCGDGFQWRRDHVEDFADFYFFGHCRVDDTLGAMQTHYMEKKGINFDRTIHGFCYFERKRSSTAVAAFKCDVHGPKFPWQVSTEG